MSTKRKPSCVRGRNKAAIIRANNTDNALNGTAEDDRIVGQGGNDTLTITATNASGLVGVKMGGGDSQDILFAGPGFGLRVDNRTGDGDEKVTGDDANDRLLGEVGQDILDGGARDDFLSGGEDDYALDGNAGQDVLKGGDGDDLLIGADGDDELKGGNMRDVLIGVQGQAAMVVCAGNDTLNGKTEDDVMTAGAGNDVFVFTPNFNHDTVMDFEDGSDRLRFFKAGVSNITDLTISDLNGDLLISVTDAPQNDVLLVGLAGAFLDAGDLVFLPSSDTDF